MNSAKTIFLEFDVVLLGSSDGCSIDMNNFNVRLLRGILLGALVGDQDFHLRNGFEVEGVKRKVEAILLELLNSVLIFFVGDRLLRETLLGEAPFWSAVRLVLLRIFGRGILGAIRRRPRCRVSCSEIDRLSSISVVDLDVTLPLDWWLVGEIRGGGESIIGLVGEICGGGESIIGLVREIRGGGEHVFGLLLNLGGPEYLLGFWDVLDDV